jgi:cytochrome d ubiquinol oxidase subunit I
VAIASNLSAVWILTANAWMQHPVGYTINQASGRAELTDFVAVISQRTAILKILHTLSASYILAAFFVMGISAYHLLRRQHQGFFRRSFRLALTLGLIASLVELVQGHIHAADVAATQPTKLAAMESHWQTGARAPIYLLALPDEDAGRNAVAWLPLPGALSLLAFHNPAAVVPGLADFPPGDRPPVLITFVAFRLMVVLGLYFVALTVLGWLRRNRLEESPWYLKLMLYSMPLPYLACALGWTVAEVGRQPWIVYGLMRTRDAASPIAAGQVLATLIGFIVVYGLLGVLAFGLMIRTAKAGPAAIPAAAAEHGAQAEGH